MPDPAGLKPARLYLALWPDAEARARLAGQGARLHRAVGGKLTRPESIHLTLVFIGDLDRQRVPALLDALSGVRATAFQLAIDRAGCWRHNGIAYLAPSEAPQPLFDLVGMLESRLDDVSVGFDRRPYRPHITLVRKADCVKAPVETFAPIPWSATEYCLVESVPTPTGMRYDLLGRFALL